VASEGYQDVTVVKGDGYQTVTVIKVIGELFDWLRHLRRRRVWSADLATGRRGEDLAHRYLKKRGFTIVARNYRLASGDAEADIIAIDRAIDELVIVEVKSRTTAEFGPPDRAIGDEKRAHLVRVARAYAKKSEIPWEQVRFDVVTVILTSPPEIEHHRDAFSLAERRY
jgi:putative endonuclease